eukprot:1304370-Alexandrium_andersonii.AAC.1
MQASPRWPAMRARPARLGAALAPPGASGGRLAPRTMAPPSPPRARGPRGSLPELCAPPPGARPAPRGPDEGPRRTSTRRAS